MHVTAAPGTEGMQHLTCHHQTPQLPASTLGALALRGAVQEVQQALTKPCAVQLDSDSGQGRISAAWMLGRALPACSTLQDNAFQQPAGRVPVQLCVPAQRGASCC